MKKKIFLLPLLLLAAIMLHAEATYLIVVPLSGSERAKSISNIGYIRYTPDSLLIYSHDNSLFHKAAFADTRKLIFGDIDDLPNEDFPSGTENASASTIRVYPNPTQDALMLENTQGESISIVTLQGQVVETIQAQKGTTVIPVSNLQAGSYLLLINSEIVKFIKQ